ncbi:MAG: DUF2796 domain-containing protein [Granulosicoccus sp.]
MSVFVKYTPAAACLSVFSLVVTTHASAETERDLDSHVHGASEMNLVIDGNSVYIEYISPWANLVGFEHQPSNDEQLSLMSGAMDALTAADELFIFNSEAECQSASFEVQSTVEVALAATGTDKHAGEEHTRAHDDDHADEHVDEEHAHDDDHADEHADDEHAHNDDHSDEEHAQGHDDEHTKGHAEVKASYTFECTNPNRLAELSVRLTESWPGIEGIAVQMAGPGGQSGTELNGAQMAVDLAAVR